MSNPIAGQNVLVTGGSRGLGRALGQALARAGARVVLVARHADELAAVVAAIRAAGGEAHAIVADVADRDATARDRRPGGGRGRPDRRADQQRQHAGAGAAAAAARHRLRGSRARAGGEPGRPVPADQGDRRADGAARRRDDRQRHVRRRDRGVRALGRLRRVEGGAGAAGARLGGGAGRHRRARPQRRPGRDGHAHARRRDPRRRPRRRWPIRRASRREIVALLQAEPGPAPGARVAIRSGPRAAEAAVSS